MPSLPSQSIDDADSDFGPVIGLLPFLRGLIKDYKRGLGILKEFIQNADDAGATQVTITADWRQHQASALPDPRMKILMGQSLLIANDRVFKKSDLTHIRTIGESSKAAGAPRIGRFGRGFNTSYNVTDFPSFVTDERIYCFDPQRAAVASEDSRRAPGRSFALKDLWTSHADWPAVFHAGGLALGTVSHPGTIFRLPLRTQASQICSEPFGPQHFQELLAQLVDTGPAILLFTKSVTAIHVQEFHDGDVAPRSLYRITTDNEEEVSSARAPLVRTLDLELDERLLASWREEGAALPLPTYRHVFSVQHEGKLRQEHWQVVTGLFADPEGELLQLAQELHSFDQRVVPWVGAAARLAVRDGHVLKAEAVTGHLYCGLPLPQEAQGSVHLHGYFDMDTARQGISVDQQTSGAPRMRVRWNELLMKHAVARAYAELLDSLRPDAGEADTRAWYELWPRPPGPTGPIGTLTREVYRQMGQRASIRVRAGEELRWSPPQELRLPGQEWREELFDPLAADGHPVPAPPLPDFVEQGLELVKLAPRSFVPADLRNVLRVDNDVSCALSEAPKPSLRRRAWVESLLRFCLADGKPDLLGLPLAILCDKKLHTFGRGQAGLIFIATAEQRSLFPGFGHWFLNPKFCDATRLKEDQAAKLLKLTPALVIANLNRPLGHEGAGPIAFQAEGQSPPNRTWLLQVFQYLAEVAPADLKSSRTALQQLALVPDQLGRLHGMAGPGTPLLAALDELTPLSHGLKSLGIPVVTLDREIHSAVARFAAVHEGLLRPFDGPNLLGLLHALLAQWTQLDSQTRRSAAEPLLDFLSRQEWVAGYTKEHKEALRSLPLFLTQEHELVSLREKNLFLPGRYEPPAIGGRLHLLNIGEEGRWRALCESLGVRSLDAKQYAEQVLLPSYPSLSEELQREALRWLRDQQDSLMRASAGAARPDLLQKLNQMALIRDRDGRMHRTVDLYDPRRADTLRLLADRARTPDMSFYADEPERWLSFFTDLGLQPAPLAAHLLQRIRDLMTLASQNGTAAVREPLLKILEHLERCWKDLHEVQVPTGDASRTVPRKLGQVLRGLAWLPVVRDLSQDPELLGFSAPGDRLYEPREVFEWRHRHLVASQSPLLAYYRDLARDVRDGLGIESPSVDLALQHLEQLIALWDDPEHSGFMGFQMDRPTQAIYQLLGDRARMKTLSAADKKRIARLSERACIWDKYENRFWLPHHVFAVQVPDMVPLRARVVFPSTQDAVNQGLAELGRLLEPTLDEYVLFLQDLRNLYPGRQLPEEWRNRVLRILKRISLLDGAFDDQLPVLTLAGTLAPVGEVYDAPDFGEDEAIGGEHVLHPSVHLYFPELGLKVDLRQLTDHVEERLVDGLVIMDDPEAREGARRLEETLRSPEFAESLLRLIFKEHRRDGSAHLAQLTPIRVRAAAPILVESRLTGATVPWPARPRPAFFDVAAGLLYVDGRIPRRMPLAVAAAFNQTLDLDRLRDLSPLSEILRYEPSMIAEELDNLGVARLPRDRALVPLEEETQTAPERDEEPSPPLAVEPPQAAKPSDAEEDAPLEEHSAEPAPSLDSPGRSWPAGPSRRSSRLGTPSYSSGAGASSWPPPVGIGPASPGQLDAERTGSPHGEDALGGGNAADPTAPIPPPIRPGSGQPMVKQTADRSRVVTYVSRSDPPAHRDFDSSSEWKSPKEDAVARVLAFEARQGRSCAPGEPGTPFDLMSREGEEVRHILVKGLHGIWDAAGVALTSDEYEAAARQGASAWLYVVENVKGEAEVCLIRDPIQKITEFRLDQGWKGLAVHGSSAPQRGMHVVLSENAQGRILDVKPFGQLHKITVEMPGGEAKVVPFLPNKHRLSWPKED